MQDQKELSNAETALMGLLAEGEKHPYQLEKDVQYREMRTWTDLSMSSIYKLLRKLEKGGLVGSRSEITEGNRARKVYSLTDEGKEHLKGTIKSLLTEPTPIKQSFYVAIYNQDLLSEEEARECLQEYREKLKEQIKCYGELEVFLKDSGCSVARQAVATRSVCMLEGELRWLDGYLASFKKNEE